MESKYLLAIPIAAISLLAVGLALAHENSGETNAPFGNMMGDNSFGMGGMMNMMGMMGDDFVHDQDDIDWMREEMKGHGVTDEGFDEMAEHCPMMRGR